MNEEDRRVKRTRKLLTSALYALINEKPYDEITVYEIAERADIGQRTFYRHYGSKDELLIDTMKNNLIDFRKLLVLPTTALFSDDQAKSNHTENGRKLFAYIEQHEALFSIIFQGSTTLYQSLVTLADQKILKMLNTMTADKVSPVPFEIVSHYLTTATIEVVKWWLAQGKPYSPEEMGKYLFLLVLKPNRDLFLSYNS